MRRRSILALTLGVVTLIAAGAYGYYRHRRARATAPLLPTFTEPGPGPRAPDTRGLGFEVGRSQPARAQARTAELGLTCKDTSMRAIIKARREKLIAETEAKKARGQVDAVSSASLLRPSKRERNPQVRWSCEGTPAEKLGDRVRRGPPGRLLLVFDSPDHPLRHVSFQQNFFVADEAVTAAREAISDIGKRLGKPTSETAPLPASGEALGKMMPVTHTWSFPDLRAKVTLLNLGRYVMVNETVEVPWPVRSDAPAR
jgi:hypothetical protein